jgi:hypothetical protein
MSSILDGRKDAAKNAGVDFTVTKEYAMALPSDFCPVFGVRLEWGTGSDNTGSFDRIVPKLGYVEGNVCWMSKRANILKRDATREEAKLLHVWFEQISQTHSV